MKESRAALRCAGYENLRADRLLLDFGCLLPEIQESETGFEEFKQILPRGYLPDQAETGLRIT